MSTRLNKQTEYNRYIAGCTYLGMEPEYEYTELTAKQFTQATEALRSRVRAQRREATKTSIAKNTANAVEFIEQGVGEPLAHFRDRAGALAKKLGKAVPIKIVRK